MAAIQLSDSLVEAAETAAKAMHRSTPKQIEHWALLGKAVEETQDISAIKMAKFEDIIGRYSETFKILSQ
jgi:ParD-like antitoxin of type II bacterial toxin-antitoxin system